MFFLPSDESGTAGAVGVGLGGGDNDCLLHKRRLLLHHDHVDDHSRLLLLGRELLQVALNKSGRVVRRAAGEGDGDDTDDQRANHAGVAHAGGAVLLALDVHLALARVDGGDGDGIDVVVADLDVHLPGPQGDDLARVLHLALVDALDADGAEGAERGELKEQHEHQEAHGEATAILEGGNDARQRSGDAEDGEVVQAADDVLGAVEAGGALRHVGLHAVAVLVLTVEVVHAVLAEVGAVLLGGEDGQADAVDEQDGGRHQHELAPAIHAQLNVSQRHCVRGFCLVFLGKGS